MLVQRNSLMTFLLLCYPFIVAFPQDTTDYTQFVDPHIGVLDDHVSNCVIGPQLPFGSINPSPHTPNGGHDGYHPMEPVRGFGQLHVSGTGWGKYGQVFISPQVGFSHHENAHDSPKNDETAKPYMYKVNLERYGITTEITPTWHSAIYKFTFPKTDSAHLLFDITHNIPMDIAPNVGGKFLAGEITVDTADTDKIFGHGTYEGGFVGGNYTVYFYAEIDRNARVTGTWRNDSVYPGKQSVKLSHVNDRLGAYLNINTYEDSTLHLKLAVSFKSTGQAKEWLESEIPGWDFESVRLSAKNEWNKQLSKIQIQADSLEKIKFYTALYHSMLMPRNRTNDLAGYDPEDQLWDDHYAVWDTWRTLFPLMMLINPSMVRNNLESFINRFHKNGYVKDAFAAGNDMPEEQGGNNIDNIFADAYVKKLDSLNWDNAWDLIHHNAENGRLGWQGWGNFGVSNPKMALYKKQGWIPAGIMSCSKTLEYAYNDYCAATIANGMGKQLYADKYLERSNKWVHLWNNEKRSDNFKGFISPRLQNNTWVDIDPKKYWGSWTNYFYEGSSWTYSYFVPHDIPGLIKLSGSKKRFTEKLQHAFKNNLIDYTNEPAFLAPQWFHYSDRSDLSMYWVRKNRKENYDMKGYPGNDDSGAMSSWYIFATLGFFPNAGQNIYYLTGPAVACATIQLQHGNEIEISAENASEENIYVQSCTFNDKPIKKAWIVHDSIMNGGKLHFVMGSQPSDWGTNNELYKDDTTTSVNHSTELQKNSLVIYPNPFKDYIEVRMQKAEQSKKSTLVIHTIHGEKMKTIDLNDYPHRAKQKIGIDLQPGMYLVSLIIDGKIKSTRKIVKT